MYTARRMLYPSSPATVSSFPIACPRIFTRRVSTCGFWKWDKPLRAALNQIGGLGSHLATM